MNNLSASTVIIQDKLLNNAWSYRGHLLSVSLYKNLNSHILVTVRLPFTPIHLLITLTSVTLERGLSLENGTSPALPLVAWHCSINLAVFKSQLSSGTVQALIEFSSGRGCTAIYVSTHTGASRGVIFFRFLGSANVELHQVYAMLPGSWGRSWGACSIEGKW